jgi:hypothetical protein
MGDLSREISTDLWGFMGFQWISPWKLGISHDLTKVKTINHGDFVMKTGDIMGSNDPSFHGPWLCQETVKLSEVHRPSINLWVDWPPKRGIKSILTLSMSCSGPQGLLLMGLYWNMGPTKSLWKPYTKPAQNLWSLPLALLTLWALGRLGHFLGFHWAWLNLMGFLEGVKGLRFGVLMKTCQ